MLHAGAPCTMGNALLDTLRQLCSVHRQPCLSSSGILKKRQLLPAEFTEDD